MNFQKKFASGEFVFLAEMNTPKGVDISEMITNARRIKDRIDGVIIPDMDNGVMRMSALGGAVLMRQQGIETIIHVYGRDRNKMAIQGDILAAHVLGIQGILVVRGEEMASGDHTDARVVDDLDEEGILRAIASLQKGIDLAGFELKGTPKFVTGCTLGPYKDDDGLERVITAAAKKVEAGAGFIVTPPVFDIDRFSILMERLKPLNIPVIPTIFLLKTVGIARYMATYEPGVFISEQTIKRIRQAPDRELECIKIAGETIHALRGIAQGVRIVTLGWEHRLPTILEYAGI
ncbi:MAG: methylenetetrahydrofolate reductase [Deltaproteobacteria bacterium]|nr:methylenetetrahydrofolate reductase [Deltaproteobacteria bacterium]